MALWRRGAGESPPSAKAGEKDPLRVPGRVLDASSAPDEMEDEYDQRDDQQEVDEAARHMKGEAAAPEQQEKDGNDE